MRSIRVAGVGGGNLGRTHAEFRVAIDAVATVANCDVAEPAAARMANGFGGRGAVFAAADGLWEPAVAVIIAG